MEFYRLFSVWIIVSLLSGVNGNEDIEELNDRMAILENGVEILSDKFDDFENRMLTDKADLLNKQEKNILKMKTDVKTTIRRYIIESLSDLLRDESVEKLIQSQVLSEMRHFKRANHQMKRELHKMRTSLVRVEEDNRVYRDGLQRGERQNVDQMSCSNFLVKSELLTAELADRDRQIRELNQKLREKNDSCEPSPEAINKEINSLLDLSTFLKSETLTSKLARHEHQIKELNLTLREQRDSCKSRNVTIKKETDSALNTRQATSVFPTTTAAVPRAITTSKPSTERSRILVVPHGRSTLYQFNIITNSFDKYPHLSLDYYDSALFVSKINSLLISLSHPHRIIISELNTSKTETIKINVDTVEMAVDEEMGIVFLTTWFHTKSISRMSLLGENFTTLVDLTHYGGYPNALAINPTIKTIYAGNYNKLFKVYYDGTGLRTLDTGYYTNGVTLDITKGLLYYNKRNKLMKMSLSSEITSEVTQFNFYIWNLVFYKNKVYYSSRSKSPGVLGVVDVEHNSVSRTLQTVSVPGVRTYSICLIP